MRLLAFVFLSAWLPSVEAAPVPVFEHLLTDEANGLQDNISAINTIAQDQQGFIWIGGENGLARYDGHQFLFFHGGRPGTGALCGNYILSMVVDYTGTLWIGTQNGLNRYVPATQEFECFLHDPALTTSLADNYVRALAVNANNRLLVGTGRGLDIFDPAARVFTHLQNPAQPLNSIRTLEVDSRNRIWIGTGDQGVYRLDELPTGNTHTLSTGQMEHYGPGRLINQSINAITEDRLGRIWIGTIAGISRIEQDMARISHYPPIKNTSGVASKARIQDIAMDVHGVIWVATDRDGLYVFDEETNQFEVIGSQQERNRSLNSSNTRVIFNDRDGDIWVGGFPRGLNYFNRATERFRNFIFHPDQPNGLRTRAVESLWVDKNQALWIGGYTGVSVYDPVRETFHHFTGEDAPSEGVISLAQTPDGDIWAGTWSAGVYRYSAQTKRFKQYQFTNSAQSLGSNYVWHLLTDQQGRLWAGTEDGGLNLYDPARDSFIRFQHHANNPKSISNNFVWNIAIADETHLWLATPSGLNLFNTKTFETERFPLDTNNPQGLKSQFLVELMVHSNGDLWIGTQDHGISVFNPRTRQFKSITTSNGLAADYVASLIEDDEHNIWAATVNGISRLSPNGDTIKNYDLNSGLVGNGYNRDTAIKDHQGQIYIGGTEGLNRFNPGALIVNHRKPNLLLTGLSVRDQNWQWAGDGAPLSISFEQNSLKFAFSAMSYRASQNNLYQTRLKGLETDWSAPVALNRVSYSNLPSGHYELNVRGANSDGVWSEKILRVPFYIAPPPWRTLWAYIAYASLLIFILSVLFLLHRRRMQLSSEKILNYKLRSLDKMKDAILANTSHELRTPLNGIIGLAQSLLDGSVKNLDNESRHTLSVIVSSGKRLAHLVDDLLDSARLMDKQMELEKTPINIYSVVSHVTSLLQPLAAQKNLLLFNQVPTSIPRVLADEARVQQIIMNLITNALKYTEKGRVEIIAQVSEQEIAISVSDTGVGISLVDLKTIFEPFSQIAEQNTRQSKGPGLGLSICQQLVELHGGKLTVSSEVGQGSVFKFTLPRINGAASKKTSAVKLDEPLPVLDTYIVEPKPAANFRGMRTILIVDDDPVNRLVVAKTLSGEAFNLLEASSGTEALAHIKNGAAIDLVLLDIMLPGMSGFEVCQEIRQHISAAHLPVVLLTAKELLDDVCRGFYSGANGYLIKPINKAHLIKFIYQQFAWVDNTTQRDDAVFELYEIFRTLIVSGTPQQTPIDRMAELLVALKQGFSAAKVLGIWQFTGHQFDPLYTDPACPIKSIHAAAKVKKFTQLLKALYQQRLLTPLNEADLEILADYLPEQGIRDWVIIPLIFENELHGGIIIGAQEPWAKRDLTLFTEAKPLCEAALLPLLRTDNMGI
jgi:signal transduction histidine kinase/ligand-binding sensor domain-containing protein/DNA-binding NarL/FixJ family response regulator